MASAQYFTWRCYTTPPTEMIEAPIDPWILVSIWVKPLFYWQLCLNSPIIRDVLFGPVLQDVCLQTEGEGFWFILPTPTPSQ